jgi:hypothetical protein
MLALWYTATHMCAKYSVTVQHHVYSTLYTLTAAVLTFLSCTNQCTAMLYKTTGLGKAVEVTCGVRGADGLYERYEYSFGPAELGYEIDMDKPLEHISSGE